jgi:hypothetical protein
MEVLAFIVRGSGWFSTHSYVGHCALIVASNIENININFIAGFEVRL